MRRRRTGLAVTEERRPDGYGLGFGTVQFGLLFLAIDTGMPTGLASLVLQASAPFTVLAALAPVRRE